MKHLDRYRGCLLGGAAGDALGYPVEFLSLTDIQEQYGPAGITSYTLQNGVAQISDDTQMTLFTANGLLFSETRQRIGAPGGGSVAGAVAAQLAALTHGHELGYIPAGVLGYCVSALVHGETDSVLKAVQNGMDWAARQFAGTPHLPELIDLVNEAVHLSEKDVEDTDAVRELGEGWVAEETLAIAVYCALKHENDFDRAMAAAVNHDGDSDSTGAVTGNLLGARLGLAGIPPKYLEHLELKSVILELADDLCQGVPPSYGKQFPPLVHIEGTPVPEPEPETPEMALWDAKYNAATYIPKI